MNVAVDYFFRKRWCSKRLGKNSLALNTFWCKFLTLLIVLLATLILRYLSYVFDMYYVDGSCHRWPTPKVHGQPVPEFSCLATWQLSLVWKMCQGLYHEVLNFLRMTPLLARDPTSDACCFNDLVMCDGVGFKLSPVKAMACGSVVQSAHVPIYEQPLGRSHFRLFLGTCNALLSLAGIFKWVVASCWELSVVLSQVISRPWHQARLKSVGR